MLEEVVKIVTYVMSTSGPRCHCDGSLQPRPLQGWASVWVSPSRAHIHTNTCHPLKHTNTHTCH